MLGFYVGFLCFRLLYSRIYSCKFSYGGSENLDFFGETLSLRGSFICGEIHKLLDYNGFAWTECLCLVNNGLQQLGLKGCLKERPCHNGLLALPYSHCIQLYKQPRRDKT